MKNRSLIRGRPAECMLDMTAFLIFKAGQLVEDRFSQHFGDARIKSRHFATLRVLSHQDGQTQQQLCESLWIDRATMTQLVRELQALKLIKRVTKEGDRRSFSLSLTAQGRKYYLENVDAYSRLEQNLFGDLDGAELKHVRQSLRKLLIGIAER